MVEAGRDRAVSNALRHSRSANGLIDLSSTPSKARVVRTSTEAASPDAVQEAVNAAVTHCWNDRYKEFSDATSVVELVNQVNHLLTSGTVDVSDQFRTEASPRYPYESPGRARASLDLLGELWVAAERRADDVELVDLAALATWVIDLWGHPYTDACGRTANIISAFALDRAGKPVPMVERRQSAIAAAYERGMLSWRRWRAYYAALVTAEMNNQ